MYISREMYHIRNEILAQCYQYVQIIQFEHISKYPYNIYNYKLS